MVEGARQVGKSTLAQQVLAHRPGRLLTLDDEQVLAAAQYDPAAFVERQGPGVLVIDEIQLAPRLLRAIKAAVDADRRPGSYLLTGSANLLTMPGAQESLAGRAETVRLFGFSQGELTGGSDSLGQVLLSSQEDQLAEHQSSMGRTEYLNLIETGSYPEAQTRTPRRRAAWVDNYVTRLLSRDADRISALAHLGRLPHLLAVLAANTSGELVKARVAADVNLPETSLPPYLDLLESFGLIHTLRPSTCSTSANAADPRSTSSWKHPTGASRESRSRLPAPSTRATSAACSNWPTLPDPDSPSAQSCTPARTPCASARRCGPCPCPPSGNDHLSRSPAHVGPHPRWATNLATPVGAVPRSPTPSQFPAPLPR